MSMAKKTEFPKGIRPNPNGTWAVSIMVKGQRATGTAQSLKEAEVLRDKLKAQLEAGLKAQANAAEVDAGKGRSWTLEYAIEQTYDKVWRGTKNGEEALHNAKMIRGVSGPKTTLDLIGEEEIDAVIKFYRKRGCKDSTINRKLFYLSRIMRTALEAKKLDEIPKMPIKKENNERIRFLSAQEEITILDWMRKMEKHDHIDATIVLIDTGVRCGELWNMEARDVNLFHSGGLGAVTIWHTKTNRPRSVPLTPRVKEILMRRVLQYPNGKLFPGGNKHWYHLVWDKVRAYMEMNDDPHFVPHVLRHTCCSRLVMRGLPLPHVQKWMGHTSFKTTLRYVTLAPDALDAGAALLAGDDSTRWNSLTGLPQEGSPVERKAL
jgi:integrase